MATFKFGRYIDIHWNGYDIQGPADTVFSIPDQLYEEFDADIAPVEPTLQWIDTNEFQTLQNSVPNYTIAATSPIAIASSTSTAGAVTKTWSLNANYSTSTHDHSGTYQPAGTYVNAVVGSSPATVSTSSGTATVSISSGTAGNGYLLAADGAGGVIFTPASTSGLTSVVGVSPISTAIAGGTVSVILDASYQTAGTYVNAVIGTSPASVVTASGTSTVSIDQAAITGATAATNAQTVRTYVKNTTGTTIPKGSAVYISGATGDNALISLSTASTEVGSSKTLGITAESIATDAFGYVVESGYLTGIDTTGISAGTSIWLGNTPGSLVFGAPPAEPSHSVYLGVVIREQQNNGSILVKVQNGYELDELHDVSAASPTDLDILQYKSSSALWTKASIANAGIAASSHTHAYQAVGNYQTAGTYVNAVIGTSPASVSTSSGTSTVSISSGTATNGQVLTADGSGGVSFTTSSGFSFISSQTISSGVSTVAKPSGAKIAFIRLVSGGSGGDARVSASINDTGAASGAGGGVAEFWVNANELTSPISYSIGAGGSGGIGGSYTSATITTTTITGTAGGSTSFGPYSVDLGRSIPSGASASSSGTAGQGQSGSGGYGGYVTASGGGSGGTNNGAKASGGGGIPVTRYLASTVGGGAAAGTESTGPTVSGGNGSNATTAGGGGGGGGSFRAGATLTANRSSGNGGNGASPGGGGGAAGALNASATNISTFTVTAGNGGTGGAGQIYVEWYG